MNCMLLWAKHGISGSLHLKDGSLYRELGTMVLELRLKDGMLHRCMIQEWASDKLTGL
jgi:hypothetical protein